MSKYTPTQYYAYYNLMLDALNPLKIVFGYDGITSIKGLGKSILKLVDNNIGQPGFQPCNFPDIIICGNKSLVKMNGLPFGTPITQEDIWPFYCLRDDNALAVMIELIWYRLMKRFNLGYVIFQDKMNHESFDVLLGAKIKETSENLGWLLYDFPDHCNIRDIYVHPEGPVQLSELEFIIVVRLLAEKTINCLTDVMLNEMLQENETILSIFVQHLINRGIIDADDNKIWLTKVEHVFFKTKDGRFFAGEKNKAYMKEWYHA